MQYYNFSARVTADQLRKTPNRNQWVTPCSPHPPPPCLSQRRLQGQIPIILTQQNTAAIHKRSQATNFSPLNRSLSLIRLRGRGQIRVPMPSKLICSQPGTADHSGQNQYAAFVVTLMSNSCGGSVFLVFAGGAWPLQLWTHITTQPRMRWFCRQESFKLHFIAVHGLSMSSILFFKLMDFIRIEILKWIYFHRNENAQICCIFSV